MLYCLQHTYLILILTSFIFISFFYFSVTVAIQCCISFKCTVMVRHLYSLQSTSPISIVPIWHHTYYLLFIINTCLSLDRNILTFIIIRIYENANFWVISEKLYQIAYLGKLFTESIPYIANRLSFENINQSKFLPCSKFLQEIAVRI